MNLLLEHCNNTFNTVFPSELAICVTSLLEDLENLGIELPIERCPAVITVIAPLLDEQLPEPCYFFVHTSMVEVEVHSMPLQLGNTGEIADCPINLNIERIVELVGLLPGKI